MSLKHALLGFLNYGPMTGYELKKVFDASVSHFWNAELSQIYPTLKQLESEGLVEMEVAVQTDRPNRKVYSITDDGRRELLEWLSTPAEADQVRDSLQMKVFFGASLPKQELIRVLRHHAEDRKRELEEHEHDRSLIPKFAEAIGLHQRDAFFWALTADAGVKYLRAHIEWLEEAIRKTEQTDDSLFAAQGPETGAIDVRKALEILEQVMAAHKVHAH